MWTVLKFGGSSQTIEGYRSVIRRLSELHPDNYVVVVASAAKGVTNSLIRYCQNLDMTEIGHVLGKNEQLAKDCQLEEAAMIQIEDALLKVVNESGQLAYDRKEGSIDGTQLEIDLISNGEQLSTRILSSFLQKEGFNNCLLDSREFISTLVENSEGHYISGQFHFNRQRFLELIGESRVIVCQGFIGSTPEGATCLLSRGGSDTSAALIADGLSARQLEIWTDVSGMYTADPNLIDSAQIIEEIGYSQAQELAAMGAKVLHPYSILPCVKQSIPIVIRNTFRYDQPTNTVITNRSKGENRVYSITKQDHITVFTVTSLDMWNNYGFVQDIFKVFSKYNVDVNIITTSQFTISTTTDETNLAQLELVRTELSSKYQVEMVPNCSIISIVGDSIKAQPAVDQAMEIIRRKNNVYIIHFSANHLSLSFVVKTCESTCLLRWLHSQLIDYPSQNPVNDSIEQHRPNCGPPHQTVIKPAAPWWDSYRSQLMELGKSGQSSYIYSLKKIEEQVTRLQRELTNIDRVFYAVKANHHQSIINHLAQLGVNFECVSLEEIRYITNVCSLKGDSSIHSPKIIFTPNFCDLSEYKEAFQYSNVTVILDNLTLLEHHGEVFRDQQFGIRVDLDLGQGHHIKVVTEGKTSKFGCPYQEVVDMLPHVERLGCKIVGLHSHRGSGIHDYRSWVDTANRLFKISEMFPYLQWLNLGGGLGVDQPVNLQLLNSDLSVLKRKEIEFWIEPGRFLVSEAGVLLTTVTQTKSKQHVNYIGLNTGMNSLIRPCLYGAYHEIHNLSRLDASPEVKYQIVGPICESGDILGADRMLPKTEIGDVILIEKAGAYGSVMSSSYNMRQPAEEHILEEVVS